MIPSDPVILVSYINTHLRDEGLTLAQFCERNDLDMKEIIDKLAAAGFQYNPTTNSIR